MAAAALLAVLFRIVDWRASLQTILQIRIPYIGVLLLISFVMNGVSCLKWQLFLTARGMKTSFIQLFRLYLVGYFFNNFMPGSVGGDVVRGMELGREINSRSNSYGSVFLERLTGFIALVAAAIAAAAINPTVIRTTALWVVIALLGLVLFGTVAFLVSRRLQDLSVWLLKYVPWRSVAEKARRFLDVVFYFRDKPRIMALAMFYSLIFHVMAIVNTYAACVALNIKADILDIAVVIPIALLVSSVPLTVNAIGLLEGAFVYFLGIAGIGAADAFSIALVLRAKNLLMSVLGGLLFAATSRGRPAEAGNQQRPGVLRPLMVVVAAAAVFAAIVSLPRHWKSEMKTIHFKCNGFELAGDLYLPAGHRSGTAVLFLHGSTPLARRHPLYTSLSEGLQRKGYTVLNLDQRGHGDSQKPSIIRTAADVDFVGDAREAARALLAGHIAGPVNSVIIAGHSFGGGVALVAGLREDSVSKVVSISPGRRIQERFLSPGHDQVLVYVQKRKTEDMGLKDLIPLDVIREMLADYDMEQIKGTTLKKPLLLIEGTKEKDEDIAFTSNVVASLSGPVQHTIIEKADHYYGIQVVGTGADKRLALIKTNIVDSVVGLIDEWARKP